ncbi:hypothetical protein TVAGG3_0297910 [Trichomonas vaginalis G3]|uniref:hypothetical protein n=1 Tax=Trichomonas vaginalis (strain ATCC PRA-98 / G3) TaxID=412133 RepID=UPI0021E5C2B3|nr:hypothetical protein TVAGG3_0297910 [Trichomonas vaginalis G3]KAI5527724.1 hypothetical protein TVAGG3_0297910 [Trichomonas vaginalis G3]
MGGPRCKHGIPCLEERRSCFRVEIQSLCFSCRYSDFCHFQLVVQVQNGDRRGAVEVFKSLSNKSEFTIVASICSALLLGYEDKISTKRDRIFDNNRCSTFCTAQIYRRLYIDAFSCANLSAARYLQDNGRWEDSVEVCKLEEFSNESKSLLRRAAHHFLDTEMQ